MSARTPAATAMAAMTIDHLSGGRFILGLGASGPQVVEGWYGRPYPRPLERTREYVSIVREIIRRDAPVEFHGKQYDLPYTGDDGMGIGKALKSTVHPLRTDIPIYLGAEGPKNVAMAAEIADGWLPLYYSPLHQDVYADSLAGAPPDFDIVAGVQVNVNEDVEAALTPVKMMLGFYIGGMGAKKRNFHKELMARMGFESEAQKIQDLFMAGKRQEAVAAVPNEFADEITLTGPIERIRDRLQAWEETPVTSLLIPGNDVSAMRALAELVL
jgi:F420-dependent oxidoreductase-like protein